MACLGKWENGLAKITSYTNHLPKLRTAMIETDYRERARSFRSTSILEYKNGRFVKLILFVFGSISHAPSQMC